MGGHICSIQLRVRYSETDQMGTFYNSRVLEWFECGRTEFLREIGIPYTEMERRDILLPVIESHVNYLGRAQYDDMLEIITTASLEGKARIRFNVSVSHAGDRTKIARGYTLHAFTNKEGNPIRHPECIVEAMTRTGDGE